MMNNLLKSFKYLTKKQQNVVPVIDFFYFFELKDTGFRYCLFLRVSFLYI